MGRTTDTRVAVYCDSQNIYHSAKELKAVNTSFELDYQKLLAFLTAGRTLTGAYFYRCMPARQTIATRKFIKGLEDQGWTVKVPLKFSPGTPWKQKNVDTAVTSDVVADAYQDKYDIAVIVSGDGDFCSGLEHVRVLGKPVEVAAFRSRLSGRLRSVASKVICLDDYLAELTYQ